MFEIPGRKALEFDCSHGHQYCVLLLGQILALPKIYQNNNYAFQKRN